MNMEKINGIIRDGKVYTLTERRGWDCYSFDCDLYGYCHKDDASFRDRPCQIYDENTAFRYSLELTERLNNPKTKEQ